MAAAASSSSPSPPPQRREAATGATALRAPLPVAPQPAGSGDARQHLPGMARLVSGVRWMLPGRAAIQSANRSSFFPCDEAMPPPPPPCCSPAAAAALLSPPGPGPAPPRPASPRPAGPGRCPRPPPRGAERRRVLRDCPSGLLPPPGSPPAPLCSPPPLSLLRGVWRRGRTASPAARGARESQPALRNAAGLEGGREGEG